MTQARQASPARSSAARALARGLVVPLIAGAASVAAFAPFSAWPVAIVALAALFAVWRVSGSPWQAALSGFTFGLAYFLVGVSWIYVSLHDFGAMPAPLAALATLLVCVYLALFPAVAGCLAVRFGGDSPPRRTLLAATLYVLMEWLRGCLFTGFPWLTVGTSQIPASPLAGFAPLLGAYGTSLAVAATAALLVAIAAPRVSTRSRVASAAGLAVVLIVGVLALHVDWTEPSGAPVRVALLQGNVSQQLKWREEVRTKTLLDYRRMVFAAPATIVVLPETALPAFLDQLPPDYLASLREHAVREGKTILMGTVEREYRRGADFDYYNSVVTIDGGAMQSYRKRHLVPFGEFIPTGFKWILAVLKIPLSDFERGSSTQKPLVAAGVRFGVAICYEDVFGDEVLSFIPAAEVLLNVSNDAWFGESFAADQHLQASQMRALETGRWMVRSTNTGVSAAIDEKGRVVGRLQSFTAGALIANVVPRHGFTPYGRWGDAAALALVILGAGGALIGRRRR